jgi:hypothetical protein
MKNILEEKGGEQAAEKQASAHQIRPRVTP